MTDDDITVTEAAEIMGCNRSWVKYLIQEKKLDAVLKGRCYFLSRKQVSKYKPQPRGNHSDSLRGVVKLPRAAELLKLSESAVMALFTSGELEGKETEEGVYFSRKKIDDFKKNRRRKKS